MSDSPQPVVGSAYQALYRRYRPQRFAQVRGQDHVALALRNAVRDSRVAHAYLFSGPRGTGKTSTARILGKALNCLAAHDGEPCGVCDSCLSVTAGSSFDVHELDAASNSGVESMRDLVARASLATPGTWKVYIVDEVHMLSTAAANALLKTLEEPPDHVIFVLATTEPQKVLPTIRSRTQHFEFHLLGDDVLAGLLEDVAGEAELSLPDGALVQALRRARGSARDALSVLDQVAATGTLEEDSDDALAALVRALIGYDNAAGLSALEDAITSGRDPQQLAVDLVERLRFGFLTLVGASAASLAALPADELADLHQLGRVRLVRAMEVVGESIVAMRDALEPRITLEVAVIRLMHPEDEVDPQAIHERLERLERRVEELGAARRAGEAVPSPEPPAARAEHPGAPAAAATPAAPTAGARAAPPPVAPAAEREPLEPGARAPLDEPEPVPPAATGSRPALGAYLNAPPAERPSAPPPGAAAEPPRAPAAAPSPPPRAGAVAPSAPPSRDELVTAWGDAVLIHLRAKVRAYYQAGRFVDSDGEAALFALPNAAHVAQAEALREEVAQALSGHFGRPVRLRLVVEPPPAPSDQRTPRPLGTPAAPVPDEGPFGDDDEVEEIAELDDEEVIARAREPVADAPTGLAWAEDRLLQAFPGAEEV